MRYCNQYCERDGDGPETTSTRRRLPDKATWSLQLNRPHTLASNYHRQRKPAVFACIFLFLPLFSRSTLCRIFDAAHSIPRRRVRRRGPLPVVPQTAGDHLLNHRLVVASHARAVEDNPAKGRSEIQCHDRVSVFFLPIFID